MTLTWNASPGATKYIVQLGLTPGSETTLTSVAPNLTTFTYNRLQPATTYCWVVRNLNVTNEVSLPSNEVCASTLGAPAAPAGVTATPVSTTRIQVSWNAVAGATQYQVFAAESPNAPVFVSTVPANTTTFVHTGLTSGTTYSYQVRVITDTGTSALSLPIVNATTPSPAGAPTNVTAAAISSSRILVSWNAVADATSYQVFGAAVPDAPVFLASVPAPTTSYTHSDLSPSTSYHYQVRAVIGTDAGDLSTPPVAATTFAAGLELYLRLDELVGATANDLSGFGRNGTLGGGAAHANDKPNVVDNKATVLLPAGTTSTITVPYAAPFNLGSPFTLALWVKPTAAGDLRIMGMRTAGCGALGWELGQDAANGLYFAGETGGVRSFGSTLPVGQWTHVAVTSDETTLRLYLNGSEVANSAFVVGNHLTEPLAIGHAGGCAGGEIVVDEVYVLSRVMTPAQIAAIGQLPDPPANLAVTVVSSTRMDLSWTAVPNALKYQVYRGTAPGNETFFTSSPASTPTYSYGHLTPNTQYSWQVAVAVGTLFSNRSNEVVATTLAPPPAPANVTATALSTTRIRVDWTAVAGASFYRVFQSSDGVTFTFRGTTSNLTFTATGLTTMTPYYFRVVAVDAGNTSSAPSATATATTL